LTVLFFLVHPINNEAINWISCVPELLFAFFTVLSGVFHRKEEWFFLLKSFLFISLPLGITAVIQKLGLFSFYVNPDAPTGGILGSLVFHRVSGTLGNPDFYGSYLTLIIFLGAFVAALEKKKGWKIFFWLVVLFNLLMLLLNATRGAWAGTFTGIVFSAFIWFFFFPKTKRQRQNFLIVIFLLSLFFLLFILFSENGFLPQGYIYQRYQSIFANLLNFQNARALTWKMGFDAFKRSPFFGYGLESFSYIYSKKYEARFLSEIPENIFFDRTHNNPIDLMVAAGILGLISYLAIFASAIFCLVKYKDKENPFAPFFLISVFLAHLVQSVFSFDTLPVHLVFFLLLAFISESYRKKTVLLASKTQTDAKKPVSTEGVDKEKTKNFKIKISPQMARALKMSILIIVPILFIYILYAINIPALVAGYNIAKAYDLFYKGKIQESTSYFKKALSFHEFNELENSFYSASLTNEAGIALLSKGKLEINKQLLVFNVLETNARGLDSRLGETPDIKWVESRLLLAQVFRNLFFARGDKKYLNDEERVLGEVIKLNPQFLRAYRLAGEMRILQGNEEQGVILLQKAYSFDKDIVKYNEWLGQSYMEAGQKEKGVAVIRTAMKLGTFYTKDKFDIKRIWQLANVYEETKNYREMAKFYEEVIARYPNDISLDYQPQLYASLATAYWQIGEKVKAKQTVEKMLLLFPHLKRQSEGFLKMIEEKTKNSE